MKRKRYTDEQIAYALRQAEAGTPVWHHSNFGAPGQRRCQASSTSFSRSGLIPV
jgi:hypothetical protein